MQIDQQRIESAIIDQAVEQLIDQGSLTLAVQQQVTARIDAIFAATVEQQITAAVNQAIAAGFERSYSRVDTFGRPIGATTTIARELENQIAGYWNQKVNSRGEAVTDSYSGISTRAEYLMTKLVAEDFHGNMKQHVINLGGTLKDKLRAELHKTVNKLLSEVIHVRSYEDQRGNRSDRSIIDPKEGSEPKPPGIPK